MFLITQDSFCYIYGGVKRSLVDVESTYDDDDMDCECTCVCDLKSNIDLHRQAQSGFLGRIFYYYPKYLIRSTLHFLFGDYIYLAEQ
tara:strand:- start:233 stop:493 length:261 start_codon:yes stop_codon:yes gene_type:complete